MSLDPEVYRGKYNCEQSTLIFDFKLRQGNIYEFSGKISKIKWSKVKLSLSIYSHPTEQPTGADH